MQKKPAALSRVNTRVRARGLRSDEYWEEVEVGKRWRLVRGGDWQEVEVGKRWRLARDGGWQEVEVGKRWRLARGGGWQEVEVGKRWRLAQRRCSSKCSL